MKKRIKIVIIIFVILMILLAGTALCIYLYTENFKSEKQLFLEYLSKSVELIEDFKDEDLVKYREKQRNTPYTNNGEITVNFKPTSGNLELEELLVAQNSNITFQGSKDVKNNYFYQNIKVNYSDTENLNIESFNESDVYGLRINNILKKYLAVENRNLKDWANELGLEEIENIPNKIEIETQDIFQEEQINMLKEKYLNIVTKNLSDEMFSKEETAENKIFTLKINKEKYKEIIIKLLENAKEDEMLINIIKGKVVNYSENTNSEEELIESYQSEIQSLIDALNQPEELKTNEVDEISVSIYVENDNVSKIEIIAGTEKVSVSNKLNIDSSNKQGIELIREKNGTQMVDFKIEKIKQNDELTYELSLMLKNFEGIDFDMGLSIDFKGITTLDTVQETCILNGGTAIAELYNLDEDVEIEASYTNSKQFTNDIPKEQVKEEDIMLLNGESTEKIQSIFEQTQSMLEKINERQMENLDVVVNPMYYFIPAAVPTSIMIACNLPNTVINTGTIANVLPIISLGSYIYNFSSNIIENTNQLENQIEQQQNQENQENQDKENQDQENQSSEQISDTEKQYLIQAFNVKYEQFKDKELTFEDLNTLMKNIKNNNLNNSNHYIKVESNIGEQVEDNEYQFSKEDGNGKFSIEYDEEGYINKIIIEGI